MIIYKATNQLNGKSYIGQTSRKLQQRINEHHKKASIENPRLLFHRAIRKYGKENFSWEVLVETSHENANTEEINLILKFDTRVPNGYNIAKGGDANFGGFGEEHYLNKMSPTDREQWIKDNRLGVNNPNYCNGKAISGDNHFLNKMSTSEREQWVSSNLQGVNNYQSKLTPEELSDKCWVNEAPKDKLQNWKTKLSTTKLGSNNPNFGKLGSNSPRATKLIIIFPDGREVLTHCIKDFADEFSLCASNLRAVQRGKVAHHKNFKAREYDQEKDLNIEVWSK